MKNELEIDRQVIFELMDTFNINNDKDDYDSSDKSNRKLKHKKKNNLKCMKLNFDDNANFNNNNNNINNNNQQKQIIIKNPQMNETLNTDWLNDDNSDWINNTECTKEYLFKYHNRLNNTREKTK
jgi:hypothetical protein